MKSIIKTTVIFFEGEIIHIPLLEFFKIDKFLQIENDWNVYEVKPIIWVEKVNYYFDGEEHKIVFIEGQNRCLN